MSAEEWDAIKGHPLLSNQFKNGSLEWMHGHGPDDQKTSGNGNGKTVESKPSDEPKGDEEAHTLRGLTVREAREMLEDTLDLNLLEKWKAVETRKVLVSVIEKQIKKLTEPEPKKS